MEREIGGGLLSGQDEDAEDSASVYNTVVDINSMDIEEEDEAEFESNQVADVNDQKLGRLANVVFYSKL